MSKEKKIITASAMLICLILIFIYCLSPLHVGINNGGMNTVFENSVGLNGINDGYFYIKYNIQEATDNTQNLFSYIISSIVKLTGNFTDIFDIRIISFIYTVLLLLSVFYLNKYINIGNMPGNIIFAALSILIFFDLSYLLYLNTLYNEAAFYVLFVLNISLYIKLISSKKPQLPTSIFFFIISIIICGLKPGLWLLIIPFSVMGIYLLFIRKGYIYRFLVSVLTLLMIILPVLSAPAKTDTNSNKFNSVFYGILYENYNSEETLNVLNIDEKYIELAGKNTFEELPEYVSSDEFKNSFYDKISNADIVKYYLTNPSKYISQYKYVGYNALETYPKYSGNYTSYSGKSAYDKIGGFNLYNFIKSKFFPKNLWFFYLVPILLIIILSGYRKKIENNGIVVMGIGVAVSSILVFNIPMITSGLADISRTMAIYNVTFDSMVLILISILLYITSKRKQEFKDKYGLSQ